MKILTIILQRSSIWWLRVRLDEDNWSCLPSHPSEISPGLEKHLVQVYISLTTSLFSPFVPSSARSYEWAGWISGERGNPGVGWVERTRVPWNPNLFLSFFGFICSAIDLMRGWPRCWLGSQGLCARQEHMFSNHQSFFCLFLVSSAIDLERRWLGSRGLWTRQEHMFLDDNYTPAWLTFLPVRI